MEGFAKQAEWQRGYSEINAFEEQLVDHGTVVLEFWMHIDEKEQLRRFREREQLPTRQHKIVAEDWRNRDRWSDYAHALTEMLAPTSTAIAPWSLIAGNDRRHARIEVLRIYCASLAAAID